MVPPPQRLPEFANALVSWNERIIALSAENQTLTTETIKATAQSIERLEPLATDVTLSMRREIEVTINSKWFRGLRQRAVIKNATRAEPYQTSPTNIWKFCAQTGLRCRACESRLIFDGAAFSRLSG